MRRLLLVEDDELVGTMVELNLRSQGADVVWLRAGEGALAAAREEPFDLIILDISLPGEDGLTILQKLRAAEIGTPVLMLTARTDVATKVAALDLGADDYLAKPFDVAELLARSRAVVRRSLASRQIPSTKVVHIGSCPINLETREATAVDGEPVVLSEREVALVGLLVRAGGRPLSRHEILDEVWGVDAFPTERTVDNFFLRLRKLFEEDPKSPRYLLTVRGVGYRLQKE